MAIEVEEGKNITIGDTTSPKFIFISDDNSPDMFRFYGVSTFYDDIHVEANKDIILEDMYDPTSSGDKSLLNLKDIIEFADTVALEDVKDLILYQIKCNTEISEEGMTGKWGSAVGLTLMEINGDKLRSKAAAGEL
jgi:L-cysteine desulfidase